MKIFLSILFFAHVLVAQNIVIPGDQLLKYLTPISDKVSVQACTGITITMPDTSGGNQTVSPSAQFRTSFSNPNCGNTSVGSTITFSNVCIGASRASLSYCIGSAGLNELAALAGGPGSSYICLRFSDSGGAAQAWTHYNPGSGQMTYNNSSSVTLTGTSSPGCSPI